MRNEFNTANEAFEYFYNKVSAEGVEFSGTRALFNVGFTIHNPLQNAIHSGYRKWSSTYAEREWQWYLSGDPNAEEIAKKAPIWYKMMDYNGNVRSNYGWQWNRNHQLDKVIQQLRENEETRQAVISIYDGKEIDTYRNDTPCTYAVNFTRIGGKLEMAVLMRSNDLWYGFCNDQYCFSKLQELVAGEVGCDVGSYYHYATNLHIYNNFLNRNIK